MILSDKHRKTKMILILVVIALSMYYGHLNYDTKPWTFEFCISHPEDCRGRFVDTCVGAMAVRVTETGFTMKCPFEEYPIDQIFPDLEEGDYISGSLNIEDSKITFRDFHIHKNRRLKIWFSLIPALVAIVYLLYTYKFNLKTFTFRPRKKRLGGILNA